MLHNLTLFENNFLPIFLIIEVIKSTFLYIEKRENSALIEELMGKIIANWFFQG